MECMCAKDPKLVDYEAPEHIYAYIVETKDDGRTKLRFWRGNEAVTGLDKRNADTDGDGLNDFEELFVTDTDPAKFDSVTENISDADIDSDNDGLTNIQEIDFETNPKSADTDNDGLTDFEEIYVYGTNPIEPDSDKDGLNDGDEIVLGLNPNKQDSDDNGIQDGEEYIEQIVAGDRFKEAVFENNTAVPSLTVFARGNVNNNICISEYTGHLKGDERAYVGKVIEISGSQINGGRLTFHLSDGYRVKEYQLNEETTNGLLICYNDGEETIPLDTVYDEESRMLYADISSGGIYFVMDVVSWLESLGIEGTPNLCMSAQKSMKRLSAAMSSAEDVSIGEHRIGGQVDIVFVVDTTGSMGGYIQNVKNNLTAFVNEIEAAGITPYFALVDYRDITAMPAMVRSSSLKFPPTFANTPPVRS